MGQKNLSLQLVLGQVEPAVPPGLAKIRPLDGFGYGVPLRLPYWGNPVPVALKSPFTVPASHGFPPFAALCGEERSATYALSSVYGEFYWASLPVSSTALHPFGKWLLPNGQFPSQPPDIPCPSVLSWVHETLTFFTENRTGPASVRDSPFPAPADCMPRWSFLPYCLRSRGAHHL